MSEGLRQRRSSSVIKEDLKSSLSTIKTRRKGIKDEIKIWLEDFQHKHNRPPTDKEKGEIRSLYELRSELEVESESIKKRIEEEDVVKPVPFILPQSPSPDNENDNDHDIDIVKEEESDEIPTNDNTGLTLEKMKARHSSWMKSRFNEIQIELDDDDDFLLQSPTNKIKTPRSAKLTPASKPKGWTVLRSIINVNDKKTVPRLAKVSDSMMLKSSMSNISTPPLSPTTPQPVLSYKNLVVGDASLQSDEDFLRSSSLDTYLPLPPPSQQEFEMLAGEMVVDALPVAYVKEFERETPSKEIVVASIPVEELQAREDELELDRLKAAQEIIHQTRVREFDLSFREEKARQRVKASTQESLKRINSLKIETKKEEDLRLNAMGRTFLKARVKLEEKLWEQKGMLKEKYGVLQKTHTSTARRYKMVWDKIPQPIDVRIHMLKSVSSKLRRGRFCILMTMYDRLGGNLMSWSKLPEGVGVPGDLPANERSAATMPVEFNGKYYNRELRFDQSVFGLCPSPCDIRPSNVLMFELYEMASSASSRDHVVGWAIMPMCNQHFRVIHGRFKIPFLKGEIDHTLKKFDSIEKRYSEDLTHWLTNMYIDIRHLPREFKNKVTGVMESEFDLQFDHINSILHLSEEMKVERGQIVSTMSTGRFQSIDDTEMDDEKRKGTIASLDADEQMKKGGTIAQLDVKVKFDEEKDKKITTKGANTNNPWEEKVSVIFKRKSALKPASPKKLTSPKKGGTIVPASLDAIFEHGDGNGELPSDNSNNSNNGDNNIRYNSDMRGNTSSSVDKTSLPGNEVSHNYDMTSRKIPSLSNWSDRGVGINDDDEFTDSSNNPDKFKWHVLTDTHEMELYGMAIAKDPSLGHKPSPDLVFTRKMSYLTEELFENLDGHSLFSVEFTATVIVLFAALWLRMYFHYMGQWMFLRVNGIPLFGFSISFYGIVIKYTSANIKDWVEIGVVAIGQLTNIVVLVFCTLTAISLSLALGSLPDICSVFVLSFGIATVLDPLLCFLADLSAGNYNCDRFEACALDYTSRQCSCVNGDAFKLWYRMSRVEVSGVTGIFYTLVIYTFTTLLAAAILYEYVIHAHMNGRMLDLHKRINAGIDKFFVPDDNEICLEELKYVLSEARRWRGIGGTLRKTHVNEFTSSDPKYVKFTSKIVHVAIFTTEVDGSKTLYRHFLRMDNGSIVEIDDEAMGHFSGQLALEKLMGGGGALEELATVQESEEDVF